jgi:hypothetical protein
MIDHQSSDDRSSSSSHKCLISRTLEFAAKKIDRKDTGPALCVEIRPGKVAIQPVMVDISLIFFCWDWGFKRGI